MNSPSIKTLTIATRHSPLAMWQSQHTQQRLQAQYPELNVQLLPVKTQGDILLDSRLSKIGGKGLFIKELEQALIEGIADIAVHSMKDMPADLPGTFQIAAMLPRGSVEDALVSTKHPSLSALPQGATIGTSSLRRQGQLLCQRPDLKIVTLRGNVQTRLQKLQDANLDAIILACAGLERLALEARLTERLSTTLCLPAVGQGAIGIECLADRQDIVDFLRPIHDSQTADLVSAERALNKCLGGNCQTPIAGLGTWIDSPKSDQKRLQLMGRVTSPDGQHKLDSCGHLDLPNATGSPESTAASVLEQITELGHNVADDLIKQGAQDLLDALANASSS